MKNFWLDRFCIGKRVRYKGVDKELGGRIGLIVRIDGNWIDVQFELIQYKIAQTKVIAVEKENLEAI